MVWCGWWWWLPGESSRQMSELSGQNTKMNDIAWYRAILMGSWKLIGCTCANNLWERSTWEDFLLWDVYCKLDMQVEQQHYSAICIKSDLCFDKQICCYLIRKYLSQIYTKLFLLNADTVSQVVSVFLLPSSIQYILRCESVTESTNGGGVSTSWVSASVIVNAL